jgi:hypothetical protein
MPPETPKLKQVAPERRRWQSPWLAWLSRQRERVRTASHGRLSPEWLALAAVSLFLALTLAPGPWSLGTVPTLLGLTLLAGALLRIMQQVWLGRLRLDGRTLGFKDMVFLLAVLVAVVVLARGYHLFSAALVEGWPEVSAAALAFGAPLAFGPLLAALFVCPQAGMLMALAGGLLAGLIWPDSAGVFAYFLLTGVLAAHYARGRTRLALISAGLRSALAGAVVVLALGLMRGWLVSLDVGLALLSVAVAGPLAGVLAAGLAPLVETAFGYTSDAKLMELASLDHPALQELMLRAPGTYHHSLVVSSLVEAAAKEIGANHLLARVAALYHDVGKIRKAAYFVENQMGGPNRHEKLAPSMSALILSSHVKEGVEMARRHRLGQPIIDIMAQHHGSRVIHFFYNKAVECRRQAGQNPPDPEAFRYPGPRPQTREAGLVMLADIIEAATRSLDNPNPARIQGLVQTQINKTFAEGQLDECELTLKDLHKIAKSFNNILNGIFHQRVEYPDSPDKAKKRHADTDTGPQRPAAEQAKPAPEPAAADLRRLGMR